MSTDHLTVACEASISVEFTAPKSRFPYFWTRAKLGDSEKWRRGEERKEMLARKPHDFAERVHPQMWSSDWCRWNRCLSTTCQHYICQKKSLYYPRDSVADCLNFKYLLDASQLSHNVMKVHVILMNTKPDF